MLSFVKQIILIKGFGCIFKGGNQSCFTQGVIRESAETLPQMTL